MNILRLTSKNIQKSFQDKGIGPDKLSEALDTLFAAAYKKIAKGGNDENKGVDLLRFCYEQGINFVKHTEGSKVDLSDERKIDKLSPDELAEMLFGELPEVEQEAFYSPKKED